MKIVKQTDNNNLYRAYSATVSIVSETYVAKR